MKMPTARYTMFVTALVLVSSSCSTPSTDRAGVKPAPVRTQDRAAAKAIVLKLRDFPRGWISSKARTDTSDAKADRELGLCIGARDPAEVKVVSVTGPDISNGGAQVGSDVTFVRTEEDARADLAALSSPKLDGCLKGSLRRALEKDLRKEGARVRSIAIRSIKVPMYGDATLGKRMTITISGSASTVTLFGDLIFILKERAEVGVSFMQVGAPFDARLQRRLLSRIGQRVDLA